MLIVNDKLIVEKWIIDKKATAILSEDLKKIAYVYCMNKRKENWIF